MVQAETSTVEVTVLDGSGVTISAVANLEAHAASSHIEARVPWGVRQFASGPTTFGAEVATELGISQFDEEYEFQGGRLRLGSAVVVDGQGVPVLYRVGAWEGIAHSLKSVQYGGESGTLVALFDLFDIAEGASGVSIRPRDPTIQFGWEGWQTPRVAKFVPDFGIIQVRPLTEFIAKTIPPWEGLPVADGELFQVGYGTTWTLILVGDNTYTKIYPQPGLPQATAIAAATDLLIDWMTG